MHITDTLLNQAKAAVKFPPVPPARPKDYGRYGETRGEWREHQGDGHLPSERFILKDGLHGWSQHYSPFTPEGDLKPQDELRDLAGTLARFGEKVRLVLGEEKKDGGPNILGVALDGSCASTPYLFVAVDRPGQRVTVKDGKVRFEGAKFIGDLAGNLTEGGTLAVEKMPKVTLRVHDKGGVLAARRSDPDMVEVKGDGCEVEKPKPPAKAVKERGR